MDTVVLLLVGVAEFLCIFANGPETIEPLHAGNTPLEAALVDLPLGHTPFSAVPRIDKYSSITCLSDM